MIFFNRAFMDRAVIPILAIWIGAGMLAIPILMYGSIDATDRIYRSEVQEWVDNIRELNPDLILPPLPKHPRTR